MPSALELKIPRRLSRSRVKFRQARGVLIIKTARFLKNGARFIIISPLSLWSRIGIGRNLNWQRTEPGPVEMFPKAQPRPSEIQTTIFGIIIKAHCAASNDSTRFSSSSHLFGFGLLLNGTRTC